MSQLFEAAMDKARRKRSIYLDQLTWDEEIVRDVLAELTLCANGYGGVYCSNTVVHGTSPRWTTVSRARPLGSRLRLRTQRNGAGLRTALASAAIQEPELP